ncbi:hypothetical protein N7451_012535 [Penicillium sp. IBT 35674x]|nr:hypothetical protein N7451_012535 [Penicillium sp. IBT 35674x]
MDSFYAPETLIDWESAFRIFDEADQLLSNCAWAYKISVTEQLVKKGGTVCSFNELPNMTPPLSSRGSKQKDPILLKAPNLRYDVSALNKSARAHRHIESIIRIMVFLPFLIHTRDTVLTLVDQEVSPITAVKSKYLPVLLFACIEIAATDYSEAMTCCFCSSEAAKEWEKQVEEARDHWKSRVMAPFTSAGSIQVLEGGHSLEQEYERAILSKFEQPVQAYVAARLQGLFATAKST